MTPEIPKEVLTGLGGIMLAALGAAFAHINKSIPLRIVWGNKRQDEYFVTREALVLNCEARQSKLDIKLDNIVRVQKELKDLFMDFALKYEGRISKIEGRLQ